MRIPSGSLKTSGLNRPIRPEFPSTQDFQGRAAPRRPRQNQPGKKYGNSIHKGFPPGRQSNTGSFRPFPFYLKQNRCRGLFHIRFNFYFQKIQADPSGFRMSQAFLLQDFLFTGHLIPARRASSSPSFTFERKPAVTMIRVPEAREFFILSNIPCDQKPPGVAENMTLASSG
jgi:hypothetical protein